MTRAVVDASVLVAVLRGGTAGDVAWVDRALAEHDLLAPDLVRVETTSALRRLVLGGRLEPVAAELALEDLLRLPLELYGFEPLARRVWELHPAVSTYDACYVALAEVLDAPLLTLDRRLARAPGLRCEVRTPSEP